MAFSLYDATVANYIQILGAVCGFLDKGMTHLREKGIDPAEVLETRLTSDMLPFRFQIVMVAYHSRSAMESAKTGLRTPPSYDPNLDFTGLRKMVTEARNELSGLKREAVNALSGGEVTFTLRDHILRFTTEDFLMSFALPNFYFHAVTAYDILRLKGAPIGKLDYMGKLRVKD